MNLNEPNIDLTGIRQPDYFDLDAWSREQLANTPAPLATPEPLGITGAPQDTLAPTPMPVPPQSPQYRTMLDSLNPPTTPAFPLQPTPPVVEDKAPIYDVAGRETEGQRKFALPTGERPPEQQVQLTDPQFYDDVQTQSSTSSQATIYSPKDKSDFDRSIEGVKKAQDNISTIMKAVEGDPEIQKQVSKIASTSMSLEDMLNPESENFKKFNDNLSKVRAQMEESDKELSDFQQEAKVNSNRFMDEMPSTKKAMLGISALLEGVGAMMGAMGGLQLPTGVVSKQIQEGIQRDIALQKDEMNSKERGLTNEANRYAKNYAMLKDDRATELKTKVDMLTASKATLDNLRAKYQDTLNSAEAEKISAGLDMEIAKTKLDLNKRIVSSNTQTSVRRIPIEPKGVSAEDVKKQADAQKALRGLEEYEVPIYGKYKVEAYSPDEAKGVREDLGSYEQIMGMLETMKRLDSQEGYAMAGTDARALGKAMAADFLLLKKNLEKLGVLSESDKNIIEDLLANPTTQIIRTARATIENQIQQSTNKITSTLNAKTKVGNNPFRESDLMGLVTPTAKRRSEEIFNRVLNYKKEQPPKQEPRLPNINISK